MSIITISEHSILPELIKKDGWILDLGCVNFTFSVEMKKYCNNIICLDPNDNITNIPDGLIYEKKALVDNNDKEVTFYIYNDIQGYSTLNPKKDWCKLNEVIKVEACNLQDIMNKYNIKQFELIKFDIEGAEYSILENIDWTISKQFSIEFHDFRFMNPFFPNNEEYYNNLKIKMEKYCDIYQHECTDHDGFPKGMGKNYWDSLFILKKKYWK